MKYLFCLIYFLITLAVQASAKTESEYKTLNKIKYSVVYPEYLPKGFKISKVHIDDVESQLYTDYTIKVSGKDESSCEIFSGHELGDNVLISGSTKKKKVKTKVFGEIELFMLTAKEIEAETEVPTKQNLIVTEWVPLLPALKVNKEGVSYVFSCKGVDEKTATKILTGLAVLKK